MKITSAEQFEALIAELEKKPSLAKGFQKGSSPADFKHLWEAISIKLNALGPPLRDSAGWQKVWRDYKMKVKKKLATNKDECRATGGGMYKQMPLYPLEEAVANLLQFNKQLSPDGNVQGIRPPVAEPQNLEQCSANYDYDPVNSGAIIIENIQLHPPVSVPEDEPCTSAVARSRQQSTTPLLCPADIQSENVPTNSTSGRNTPVRARKKKSKQRHDLLEQHTHMQKSVLTDVSNKIASMKRALRDTAGYQQKILDIEQKKLALMEKRDRREVELHKANLKLKEIKLQIATTKLKLLKKKD